MDMKLSYMKYTNFEIGFEIDGYNFITKKYTIGRKYVYATMWICI